MKKLFLSTILALPLWAQGAGLTNSVYSKAYIDNLILTNNAYLVNYSLTNTAAAISNINSSFVYTPTNAASTTTIDFSKREALLITNNVLVLTGVSGWSDTNFNYTLYYVSNTTGVAKLCTVPASVQNMDPAVGVNTYVTNFAEFKFFGTRNTGTNYFFKSR